MSAIYPDLDNQFPSAVDTLRRFVDPDSSALPLIAQYKAYYNSGKIEAASAILDDNPQLKNMIVNASRLNELVEGLISVERFYFDTVHDYIVEVVKYRGAWSSTQKYVKYNVVSYDVSGATQYYMCVGTNSAGDDTPMGTLPTDSTYWVAVTLRGERGPAGSGLSPAGSWNVTTSYTKDQLVAYNNVWYVAKRDNAGVVPGTNPDVWEPYMQLHSGFTTSGDQPIDQAEGEIWIEVVGNGTFQQHILSGGAYVPLYTRSSFSYLLSVDAWSGDAAPYSCVITNDLLNGANGGVIMLSPSATIDERVAACNLQISSIALSGNQLTIQADGIKPAIALPLIIEYGTDFNYFRSAISGNYETLEAVTTHGNTTSKDIALTSTTASTSTGTGALTVAGGVGVTGDIYADQVYGAVWNDYAEYRECGEDHFIAGRCMCESPNGKLYYSTKRRQPCGMIVSDTFGFSIGKTEECDCPIAVSGRVLAYTDMPSSFFKTGDAVCTGKNGTVSKMRWWEKIIFPDRIVGTVSYVPMDAVWGPNNILIDGRVWVNVR